MTENIPEVSIRRISIDDLDVIQALYESQNEIDSDPLSALRVNNIRHAIEMKRIRQQWIIEQRYLAFVATIPNNGAEKCIGYIAALIESQASLFKVESYANIGELWILPDYRGHGIGKCLAEELLENIRNLGIEWVSVHLNTDNDIVENFLKKVGFKTCAIEMRRQLD